MAKYVSSPVPVADLVPDIIGPDDKGRVWVHFRSGGMRAGISFEAKDGVAQCIRAWRDDLIKALSPPSGERTRDVDPDGLREDDGWRSG